MFWKTFLKKFFALDFAWAPLGFPIFAEEEKRKPVYAMYLKIHFKNKKEPPIELTPREAECLAWVVRGKSSREIGLKLKLSQRTVEFYINNVKRKFKCRRKSELVRKVFDTNFFDIMPK